MDATVDADKRSARLEERRFGVAGGRFADIGVSGFRLLVPGVVRSCAGDVGGGTGKGIDLAGDAGRLDIWNHILLRNLLVADLRPDHLRRLPADRRVSVVLLRRRRCGAVSGDVRGRAVGAAAKVWLDRVSGSAVRVGGDGVLAALGDGE